MTRRTFTRLLTGLSAALLLGGLAAPAQADPIPVSLDLTALRAVQTYALDKKATDDVYVVVSGVAAGQPVHKRLPEKETWKAAPKNYPIAPNKEGSAVKLWEGKLNDGEFALLTVTLYHGTGKDAGPVKAFQDKLAAATKDAAGKKTLTQADFKALHTSTLKAHREVVKNVKETLSREKKTDHFGGQFTVLLWNDGGKLVKRLDPVGLTFGEHYGTDVKVYSKLKYTRPNVFTQDDAGEWAQEQLAPLNEETEDEVRVKMLETEYVGPADSPQRNVTDYVLDVRVTANGKPVKWELNGEQPGPSDVHTYWDYAE